MCSPNVKRRMLREYKKVFVTCVYFLIDHINLKKTSIFDEFNIFV